MNVLHRVFLNNRVKIILVYIEETKLNIGSGKPMFGNAY